MTHKRLRVAIVVLALVLAQLGHSPTTARALTLTVNTTSDLSGTGCLVTPQCSLRRAINEANANPGPDIIQFNIPGTDPGCSGGVCTIQPASALPALTGDGTTVDGYTQPGAAPATKTGPAVLKIELDGTNAGLQVSGLAISAANNVIRGLAINRFYSSGIYFSGSGATDNTVSGNYIGTDTSGAIALGNGAGITISPNAQGNVIGGNTAGERNVISGNQVGVNIFGSGTTDNTVSGNYIGTDASGTTALGNLSYGVTIDTGAQYNVIGGDTAGERNIISGNGCGVEIIDGGTTGNVVSGNYIGTDVSGTAVLSNTLNGVGVGVGARNNTVGGDTPGERNVISGNGKHGILITDGENNVVSGNYIGTDASGTVDLGNAENGVAIKNGAQYAVIGGDTAGERNVISGNDDYGVYISGSDTMSNTVSGNYIGTDASGTADLGNAHVGVGILSGAKYNTVGGDTPGERNVIAGNNAPGVFIEGSGTTDNTVSGNTIGTDASGTADLGNTWHGVGIWNGAQDNTIGPGNVIAHNGIDGVEVNGGTTSGNVITQNSIFANSDLGIDLWAGANGSIATPAIASSAPGAGVINVSGTACAGCTVEAFASAAADGEGEAFVGDTVAGGGGSFTVAVPIGSLVNRPYVTVTATDAASGTSEFSAVYTVEVTAAYLPLVLR